MQTYIIQVAPLIRLPLGRTQVFSYWYSQKIACGSLVTIPLRFRAISGIVISSRAGGKRDQKMPLKKIHKVAEENLLTEEQIAFARKISSYCFAPLGIVLKSMVPQKVKAQKKPKARKSAKKSIPESAEAESIRSSAKKEFVLLGDREKRDSAILALAGEALRGGRQSLFLVSEIFGVEALSAKIRKYFPAEAVAIVHSGMAKGELFANWEKIKNGKARIIIASKVGLFLPFFDLALVAVFDSQDISFKQWDMSPRYHAARAAEFLSEIHGAKLVFSNSAPSLELFKKAGEKSVQLVRAADGQTEKTETVAMNLFEKKKNPDFPVTRELYKELALALEKRKKILIVVNRKGFSAFAVCQKCKSLFRCPQCERALVYFDEAGIYKCPHCSHKADLLSACPSCGAHQFIHRGIGLQLVEKKIGRLFPAASIAKMYTDRSSNVGTYRSLVSALEEKKFDVLMGTQTSLKASAITGFDLVVFPNFHDIGSIPDFGSREFSFSLLAQARDALNAGGKLIVQTYAPDDPVIQAFQKEKEEDFFPRELKQRERYLYPPFTRLVKLTCREKSIKKAETEAGKAFDLLKKLKDNKISIDEPYEPLIGKKRGFYYRNILIKCELQTDFGGTKLASVVRSLGKNWMTDADPISTI